MPPRRWAVLPAAAAPVLLIGGWTLAAARQSAGFDSTRDTISALAGPAADDPWIMTAALAGLGACHLLTSIALRSAGWAGRVAHAIGGIATIGVATFPLAASGPSKAHGGCAAVAFGALAIWPALAVRREPDTPRLLRPAAGFAGSAGLILLIGGFVVALAVDQRVGLAERVAAAGEALWPLAVALSSARSDRPTLGETAADCPQ